MKIVILFTGSTSTGKTTLLKALQEYYNDTSISVMTEVVRELKQKKIIDKADVGVDSYTQLIITSEAMRQYFEKLNDNNSLLISERSPIDVLAFTRHSNCSYFVKNLAQSLIHLVYNYKKTTFITFYFPPTLKFEQDDIRIEEGRDPIDKEILSILEEFHIPYITMIDGSVEERKQFVLRNLENL